MLVIILFLLLGKEASGAPTKDVYTSRLASSVVAPTYSIIKTTQIPDTKKIPSVRAYRGNCVQTLKDAGILKCTDCSPTDRAIDIPTNQATLADGKCAVAITREGGVLGHALYVCKKEGSLISTVEGGYVGGQGRVVSPDVVKGFRI